MVKVEHFTVHVYYHNFFLSKSDWIKYFTGRKKKKQFDYSAPLVSPYLLWLPLHECLQPGRAQRAGVEALRMVSCIGENRQGFLALEKTDRDVFFHQLFYRNTDCPFTLIRYGDCSHSVGGVPRSLAEASFWDLSCPIALRWGCTSVLFCLSYLYRWLKTLCLYKLETIRLGQQRQPEAIF